MSNIVEYLNNMDNTVYLMETAEWLTILVSSGGIIIAFLHWFSLRKSTEVIGKRMRGVFFTDGLVYVVTFFMGVGLFLNLPVVIHYDIIIRPLVLFLNVIASWRLYVHFRSL